MKEFIAKSIFPIVDILVMFVSLLLAYLLRNVLTDSFGGVDSYPLANYTAFYPIYIVTVALLVCKPVENLFIGYVNQVISFYNTALVSLEMKYTNSVECYSVNMSYFISKEASINLEKVFKKFNIVVHK